MCKDDPLFRDIRRDLEERYGEEFEVHLTGTSKVEFWSDNHLFIYNMRTDRLQQCF